MTDAVGEIPLDIPAFYDRLAPEYDAMTGFDQRFVRERPFFRLLVERYGISTALDAGSGTGFHSLLLARLGVRVTAVDVSSAMLDRLGEHARTMGLHVRRLQSTFQDLHDHLKGPFDALFCLGNSLPHLLSDADLRKALASFRTLLRPGGKLFLQMLNYDRIMASRDRVQHVRDRDGTAYVRMYDYERQDGLILFSLLRIDHQGSEVSEATLSLPLRPLGSGVILNALADAGFEEPRTFGSIAMDPYHAASSGDLVVEATTPVSAVHPHAHQQSEQS